MFDGDKFCRELADLLIINKNKTEGLFHGNAGVVMFLFVYSRKSVGNLNNKYEEQADAILEYILKAQSETSSPDFEMGLSGIGWLIEYLLQNGYSEGNSDEILEDFDNVIYKYLISQSSLFINIRNGLTGYLFYLINRLKTKDKDDSIKTQVNRELFIETINRIDMSAPNEFSMLTKDISFDILWSFPLLLIGLNEAYKLNIYNDKIENMLNQWLFYFKTNIPSVHIHRVSLATSLYLAYKNYDLNKIKRQVNVLLYSAECEAIKSEMNLKTNGCLQKGWVGIVLILTVFLSIFDSSYPNYNKLKYLKTELLHDYLDEMYYDFEKYLSNNNRDENMLGLFDGWTGLGLLYILYPSIFKL